MPQPDGDSDGEDDGRTATFPFLNQLFGGNGNAPRRRRDSPQREIRAQPQGGAPR